MSLFCLLHVCAPVLVRLQGTFIDRPISFKVFLLFCLTNIFCSCRNRVCFAFLPVPTPLPLSFFLFPGASILSFPGVRGVLHRSSPSVRVLRICPVEVVHRYLPSGHFVLVLWTCGLFWHRFYRAWGGWKLCIGFPERTHCVGPMDA